MRLGTLNSDGRPSAAAFVDDLAVLVDGYSDAGALIRGGDQSLADARRAIESGPLSPYLDEDLLAPILEPGAVICVGLNFQAHILEMGHPLPDDPTLFLKHPRALTGPRRRIPLPAISDSVDYEGELVAVIGRRARNVSVAEALSYVAGFTLLNDVSMRDYQYRTQQWFAGKNFERSTPTGPWIVTTDELGDVALRKLSVRVNGELRQQASLGDLVFDPAELVADVSRILTLEPGDLISTGTPSSVGFGMEPKTFLTAGDVVEVEIDGIGVLRNEFVRDGQRGVDR